LDCPWWQAWYKGHLAQKDQCWVGILIWIYSNDNVSLELVYEEDGIFVIIIVTILEPFQIIIHHRWNFILKSFLVVCGAPFQCFCLFVSCCFSYILSMLLFFFFFLVYLYLVLNLFRLSLTFCLPNQEWN
jgi:hypothetical protein